MENKNTFLQSIIVSLKASVKRFAFNRMTADGSFNMEEIHWQMENYGYETVGECVTHNYLDRLFTPKRFKNI